MSLFDSQQRPELDKFVKGSRSGAMGGGFNSDVTVDYMN